MYPIVTVSDSRYLPSVQFCLESILEKYHREEKIKFYILYHTDDLKQQEIDDFLYYFSQDCVDVKFVTSNDLQSIKTAELFARYAEKKSSYLDQLGHGHSVVPNWRALRKIWIADAVYEDKILYLDCDTYLFGNIERIFEYTTEKPFAAATDFWPVSWTQFGGIFEKHISGFALFNETYLNQKYMSYFNTGVFITSLNYWRDNNLLEQAKQFIENYIILYTDQDLLNYFFKDNFIVLPPQFNAQGKPLINSPTPIEYYKEPNAPVIIHFCSDFKPCFKKFGGYRLYDTPENQLVDELPNKYMVPAVTKYNTIKRKVIIKEAYMTMKSKHFKTLDLNLIDNYASSEMSLNEIFRLIKKL
jgi:lipopolysaccharide biosynthesis glycosyltransferase